MVKSYKEYVEPYMANYQTITISPVMVRRIDEFVRAVIEKKKSEEHHKRDKNNEYKRFYTGTLGEAAIEILLGQELIDWTIGDSNFYNEADLRNAGVDVGIKTVDYGSFPIIHKTAKRPEFINLRVGNDKVIVCGLATIAALQEYQDDELILSPALRARGTKTGFYGFGDLILIRNMTNIRNALKNRNQYTMVKWWE